MDLVGVSHCLLRAMNLPFLEVTCSLLQLFSELLLVTPLAITDLVLPCLGGALLMGGGLDVDVCFIWAMHNNLLMDISFCCLRKVLVTALPSCSMTTWMASCIVWCTIAISESGEYTDLAVRLQNSGEEGLEVFHAAGFALASYLEDISIWESV